MTSPIIRATVFQYLPNSSGVQKETDTTYDNGGLGLVQRVNEYDYGSGAVGSLLRQTLTSYAPLTNNILNRPLSITVEDGGSNIKAQTSYTYDQGGVTGTTGTPQHIGVSGSRGNPTTVATLVQGTTTLQKTFTYYDTGTPNTSTDVNGAVTTYNYASGSASCGNSFVTSVSEPLSLSRSMTWDCTGGVVTSATDENGKSVTLTHNDSLWRVSTFKDQLQNATNYFYYDVANNFYIAPTLWFNNNASLVQHDTDFDPFGRITDTNTRNITAGNYESTNRMYDTDGRLSRLYMPCGQPAPGLVVDPVHFVYL